MPKQDRHTFLASLETLTTLNAAQWEQIDEISKDTDVLLRNDVAGLLVLFPSEEAGRILERLASDEDETVRASAYDSLSAYADEHTLAILKDAIDTEVDIIARSYAIIACAEVMKALKIANENGLSYFRSLLGTVHTDLFRLDCDYGLYLFGDEAALTHILSFFKNEDYHMRCSVLSVLESILCKENLSRIQAFLIKAEKEEAVKAVLSHIRELLEQCDTFESL